MCDHRPNGTCPRCRIAPVAGDRSWFFVEQIVDLIEAAEREARREAFEEVNATLRAQI
jgi:hypothetical protein